MQENRCNLRSWLWAKSGFRGLPENVQYLLISTSSLDQDLPHLRRLTRYSHTELRAGFSCDRYSQLRTTTSSLSNNVFCSQNRLLSDF